VEEKDGGGGFGGVGDGGRSWLFGRNTGVVRCAQDDSFLRRRCGFLEDDGAE
jgi:hypothetical protein